MSRTTKKNIEDVKLQIMINSIPIMTQFAVPRRSGRLKESFKYNINDNGWEITTDIYYMPFTNEPWVSPRWKGRQNPNLKWFDENAEYIAKMIARHTGGKYVRTQ